MHVAIQLWAEYTNPQHRHTPFASSKESETEVKADFLALRKIIFSAEQWWLGVFQVM